MELAERIDDDLFHSRASRSGCVNDARLRRDNVEKAAFSVQTYLPRRGGSSGVATPVHRCQATLALPIRPAHDSLGLFPSILGYLLMLSGAAYVMSCTTFLLFPEQFSVVNRLVTPLYFGEVPIILWMMIVGAKRRGVDTAHA